FLLKDKNATIYDQLIQKIVNIAYDPIIFDSDENGKSKRWRLANIRLISEIHRKNAQEITSKTIKSIIDHLSQQIDHHQSEHLEILCELLKTILPDLSENDLPYV